MDLLIKVLVCFIAGAGAGIGTGFAGMSAAAVISPMLVTFLGIPAYHAKTSTDHKRTDGSRNKCIYYGIYSINWWC